MATHTLTFDSLFSVSLHEHLLGQFLSLTAAKDGDATVAIAPHQVSAESATQLGLPPMSLELTGMEIPGAIAGTTLGSTQPIMAQQFEESDLGGQVQDAWGNFVESGQIWALCVGVIFGYMFRTFTGG